jgi:hypothetical protein
MADQPPPRRRFQFSLRTLMLVVVIAAVICAVCLPALKEWQAIRERERQDWRDTGVTGSIEPFKTDIP